MPEGVAAQSGTGQKIAGLAKRLLPGLAKAVQGGAGRGTAEEPQELTPLKLGLDGGSATNVDIEAGAGGRDKLLWRGGPAG